MRILNAVSFQKLFFLLSPSKRLSSPKTRSIFETEEKLPAMNHEGEKGETSFLFFVRCSSSYLLLFSFVSVGYFRTVILPVLKVLLEIVTEWLSGNKYCKVMVMNIRLQLIN